MMTTYCSRAYLNRLLYQCLSVGTLTTLSVLLGLAPNLSGRSPTLVFSSAAYADSSGFSNLEVQNYAKSVLAIERGRLIAYRTIKEKLGGAPNIACSQPDSIQALPANVRDIAVNYCTESKQIVERNGLDVARFNQITVAAGQNTELQKRIQNAMMAIQNGK